MHMPTCPCTSVIHTSSTSCLFWGSLSILKVCAATSLLGAVEVCTSLVVCVAPRSLLAAQPLEPVLHTTPGAAPVPVLTPLLLLLLLFAVEVWVCIDEGSTCGSLAIQVGCRAAGLGAKEGPHCPLRC